MSLVVTISGGPVNVLEQSTQVQWSLDQRSTASLTVRDDTGMVKFQPGQPVSIIDSANGFSWNGWVNDAKLTNATPNATNLIQVNVIDHHYLADRVYSRRDYANWYAGDIGLDLLTNYLAPNGVTALYALRRDSKTADWNTGTLTNVVGTSNVGSGDLELSPAGTDVVIQPDFSTGTFTNCAYASGMLAPIATPAVKIVGIQSVPGANNSYAYVKIWSGSAPAINNHFLVYDIWIDPSSPEAKIGVDIVFTDGTTLRDNVVFFDAQNLSPHPGTDLKGVALGQWYHRLFFLSNLNGKTISYVTAVLEGDSAGTYTGWIKSIRLLDSGRNTVTTFFGSALNTVQPMQTNGYHDVGISVVNTYDLPVYSAQLVGAWTPTNYATYLTFEDWGYESSESSDTPRTPPNWFSGFDVDVAQILKSSFVSWQAVEPENTQIVVSWSLDSYAWIEATKNAALPNLLSGLTLAGKTLYFCVQFFRSADNTTGATASTITPEVTPSLSSLECTVNPAYNATKTDVLVSYLHNGDWTGTFSNTLANALLDNQQPNQVAQYTWLSGTPLTGFDLFSTSGAAAATSTSTGLQLTTGANSDVRLRATANGEFANGLAQVWVFVSATVAGGLVYRTSNWGNANDSYAYSATMTTTQVLLGRGTNSTGAGAFTTLGTATISLTAGTEHSLSVVFMAGTHQVFVDNNIVLTVQDSTYLTPGYTGLRAFNSGGSTASVTLQSFTNYAGRALSLFGAIRNWDDGINAGQSFFTTSGSQGENQKAFQILVTANGEARSRMDFAAMYSNFIMEFDIFLDNTGALPGFVYRDTGWQTADASWAYCVEMSLTSIVLKRGNNSSSGTPPAPTTIASASISLASGNWHHVKAVVSGSSHQIFLDDIRLINATDATYTAPGYVGFRNRNPNASSYSAQFDNFGIMAALTGTWTSNSISVASAGTYGNSLISWRDMSSNTADCTVLVQTSIDGGTTYLDCTNGAAIPGFTVGQSLAGVGVLVKVTLTTTAANSLPAIDNLIVQVLGAYTASGNRISTSLPLTGITQLGDALVYWDGLEPTNTSMLIDTSFDGSTWTNIGSGASGNATIPGITAQSDPSDDTFDSDTSADYTSTHRTGGSNATWIWDTALSRVEATGGSSAILALNGVSAADVDFYFDTDQADSAGCVWRYADASNFYGMVIYDGSATSGTPNTMQLFKVVSGVRTQIGSTTPITLARGVPARFHVTMQGASITIQQDGATILTAPDGALTSAGQAGLWSDTGTSHYYQFRMQTLGQDVSAMSVYTRARLSSTDPIATPQLEDLTVSVRGPEVQRGAFIPQAQYSILAGSSNTIAADNDDLAKKSSDGDNTYWWRINQDKSYRFRARGAVLAPWVLTGDDIRAIVSTPPTDEVSADLYRNLQILTGGVDTIALSRSFKGDGQTQTWTLDYNIDVVLSITVNGAPTTVGIQGVDTGKDFYYTPGQNTFSQDTGESPFEDTQLIAIDFEAQVNVVVEVPADDAIALRASVEGSGNGIVEVVEDVSQVGGSPMNKLAMLQLGQGRIQQYAVIGETFEFITLRAGLAPGQILSAFVPQFGLQDAQFLIEQITLSWKTTQINGIVTQQPFYLVQAIQGPVLGDYARFFSDLAAKA